MPKARQWLTWKVLVEGAVALAVISVLFILVFSRFERVQERAHVVEAQRQLQDVLRAAMTFTVDSTQMPIYRMWRWNISDATATAYEPQLAPVFLTTPVAYLGQLPAIGDKFRIKPVGVRLTAIPGVSTETVYLWIAAVEGPYGALAKPTPVTLPPAGAPAAGAPTTATTAAGTVASVSPSVGGGVVPQNVTGTPAISSGTYGGAPGGMQATAPQTVAMSTAGASLSSTVNTGGTVTASVVVGGGVAVPAPAPGPAIAASAMSGPLNTRCYSASNGLQSYGMLIEDTNGFSCGPMPSPFDFGKSQVALRMNFAGDFDNVDYGYEMIEYPRIRLATAEAELLLGGLQAGRFLGALVLPNNKELAPLLKSDSLDVRFQAAAALATVFPQNATGAVPILLTALQADDSPRRRTALISIRSMGANAVELVPALLALHEKADSDEAELILEILAEIGVPAKEAIPALEKARNSDDPWLRQYALSALIYLQQ